MTKKLIAALAVVVALGLTACDKEDSVSENIRHGKECAEAGGSWDWSDFTGYHCEINAK